MENSMYIEYPHRKIHLILKDIVKSRDLTGIDKLRRNIPIYVEIVNSYWERHYRVEEYHMLKLQNTTISDIETANQLSPRRCIVKWGDTYIRVLRIKAVCRKKRTRRIVCIVMCPVSIYVFKKGVTV